MQTVDAWSSLADTVFVPHTEAEYQKLITLLDRLVDEVGENESYPLASPTEIVDVLIEKYEDAPVPELPIE
jgi:HTH-type transcriptional regulator / antitoxin HigA